MSDHKDNVYDIKYRIKNSFNQGFRRIFIATLLVVLGTAALSCFYTVAPDEEAVIIRLGKYYATYPPGLHFKMPFGVDRLMKVQTTKVHQEEFGFRTRGVNSRRTSYSNANFHRESLMLTGDLNVAEVEWVVQYKISDPYKYIFQARNPEQNIRDVSESIMRRVVGDRLVNEVLTTGRSEIANEAKTLMQKVIDKYDIGIQVVAVKLQDVNPPDSVKPSFNEVNKAKQEQEKLINQAEENYNKVIPRARGLAEKVVSRAQGRASELINRAKGDASRFRQVQREFRKAPEITKKRLYLEAMQEVYESAQDLTIIDKNLRGVLPIYNSGKGPGAGLVGKKKE